MIYYIYYDSYGNPRKSVSADELKEHYQNDADAFLMAVRGEEPGTAHMTAHVGTLNFKDEQELNEFMETMNEAHRGFFEGEGDSRPYNF